MQSKTRLLFLSSSERQFVMQEIADALGGGAECKITTLSPDRISRILSHFGYWFRSLKRPDKKLTNIIDTFKPDFAFVDSIHPNYLTICYLGVPLLAYVRGDFWTEYRINRQVCPDKLPRKLFYTLSKKERNMLLNNAAAIFTVSNDMTDITNKKFPNKCITLYHGLDSAKWHTDTGMKLKHPSVGIVQNASAATKCREMFVLEKVLKTFPDVTFYWAGFGRFENMVLNVLGKYKNFVHLGQQDPDNIRKLLTEVDIYILASGQDALPVTVLEAQMMSKPVIVTNVGGVPEEIQDGKTGFLVEKGNPDQIIEKIKILLDDPQRAREMGKAGRRFVEENFNWNTTARTLLNYIESQKHYL